MVGLVIVSHSKNLAAALEALARQLGPADVPIAAAAGVGPERSEFGTDAVQISEAIESVYSEAGVLVMMDLGSAVMSAQMALELLPPEYEDHIVFCAAPLVEGTLAAVVQISMGADLPTVCREALQALRPKEEMIGPEEQPPAAPVPDDEEQLEAHSIDLTLHNAHGLHARPAAKFVLEAGRFDAQVTVRNLENGKGPVSAGSFNALATLGALAGHTIRVSASGPAAADALAALRQLVEDDFGEGPAEEAGDGPVPAAQPEAAGDGITGVPISGGFAVGPLFRLHPAHPEIPAGPVEDPDEAWARLEAAVQQVDQAIAERRSEIAGRLGEDKAAIFDAHRLILKDPALAEDARAQIYEGEQNEIAAWFSAVQSAADVFRNVEDVYLRQRAADVIDVGEQVVRALTGESAAPIAFEKPVILLAEELTPTQTAQLEMDKILALLTRAGGPTSHSAILARSFGIPAVTGVPQLLFDLPEGSLVGLDGSSGRIWVKPDSERVSTLAASREAWLAERQKLLETGKQPGTTRDGVAVEIAANAGNVADARAAVQNGAEGIGLLRTEFLFLTRAAPPDEEDQYRALREIAGVMGDLPVTVRTLDVGGDKPLPYIDQPQESNPFLGMRAIRLSLRRPELFMTQLRAILRAGEGHRFRVMFPMVANLDELFQAKSALEKAHSSLAEEGVPHAWPVETGIMVEIPAAALTAHLFAPHVDFFSVGTNDLTQYTLAAERGNPELSDLTGGIHPAVLRLVRATVEAADSAVKWVGVCGEMAGDPQAAALLIGLGVRELSMSPAGVPAVKAAVRAVELPAAAALAEEALQAVSAEAVRTLVGG